jgi:hypothetical protein
MLIEKIHTPKAVRYIKLGEGGKWEAESEKRDCSFQLWHWNSRAVSNVSVKTMGRP